MFDHNTLLFIIPCFNEEKSIRQVVLNLKEAHPTGDIVIIDDGSTDNSVKMVEDIAMVIRLPMNLGIGGAMQCGILFAQEHNYDFCMQVDGDGQHPASEVKKFLEGYVDNPANLLIGSRFLYEQETFKSTVSRRLGITLIRTLVHYITEQRITDPTSGYRLLDRKAIGIFSKDYSMDYPEPISLAIAKESGLSMREIPVCMNVREYGRSSISGFKNLAYMVRVCGYLVAVRLRRTIRV